MGTQRNYFRPLTAVLLLLACGGAHGAVGSWSTNGPGGGHVVALAGYEVSPTTLWGAGRGGVFRTTSGGSSWTRVEIGLPESLFVLDLTAASAAPVLYLATSTQLFRSGNGGDLWVPLPSVWAGQFAQDISLRRASSNDLALATDSALYVSADGGASWSAPGAAVTAADAAYAGIEYAVDGTLYAGLRYNNGGVFGGALILRSTTGGASWAATAAQPAGFFSIAQVVSSPLSALRLFASDGSSVQTSANGGASWNNVPLPATGVDCGGIRHITPHPGAAAGLIVACADRGLLLTADASVASPVWQTFNTANGYSANGVDVAQASAIVVHPGFPASASLWVGTEDGGLLASSTGGTSWTAINNGFQSANIRALATHPVDTGGSAVFFAGYGDAVTTTRAMYKSADAGGSWNSAASGLNAEQIRGLAIDPTTVDTDPLSAENFTVYAAGRSERIPDNANKDGGLYKSTNAGASWSTIDSGIALVGGRPDMGTVRVIAPDPRSCTSPPPSGPCPIGSGGLRTLYAAGSGRPNLTGAGLPFQSARIYKSTNAGASWTASESGLPLPQDLDPSAATNLAYMGGIAALVFDPGNTQTLYAGGFLSWANGQPGSVDPTLANGVFKSTNGGASWVHASNGLPRYAGAGSSHWSVLALAINPANPQVIYAGLSNLYAGLPQGTVYKSIDGGANWNPAATGIAGQDVRALFIDAEDPSGDTIYAGTGGDGANPGGVYRSSNGGASWNSLSLGLPADAATALAMPRRTAGAPARILAGTSAGVWDYTAVPDGDADGAPTAVENGILAGDGNADGLQDATQPRVASLNSAVLRPGEAAQGGGSVTVAIQPGSCSQLNDVTSLAAALYPPDSLAGATSHDAHGLVSFSLPACAAATVRVTFHGAAFDNRWSWRNYGPRVPGDANTFGWYRYGSARRIDAQTWELRIDALRQGNYRADANDILFAGGPARSDDLIFSSGQE
jgi:photosystem II stability/assembly factor-like uncharacterized protein